MLSSVSLLNIFYLWTFSQGKKLFENVTFSSWKLWWIFFVFTISNIFRPSNGSIKWKSNQDINQYWNNFQRVQRICSIMAHTTSNFDRLFNSSCARQKKERSIEERQGDKRTILGGRKKWWDWVWGGAERERKMRMCTEVLQAILLPSVGFTWPPSHESSTFIGTALKKSEIYEVRRWENHCSLVVSIYECVCAWECICKCD